jgi:hypothetical protein
VRIASWVFVVSALCAFLSAFLPCIDVTVGGLTPRRTSLSLYKITTERKLAGALFGKYSRSHGRVVAEKLTDALVPRMGSHKAHLDDAQDAMQTLDELSEDDVRNAGLAITIAVWTLLVLSAAMALLVLGELVRREYRRRRTLYAGLISVVVGAIAVGAHLGVREAVWQANDELGSDSFGLAVAAYLLPAAGVIALGAAITANVLAWRGRAAPPSR